MARKFVPGRRREKLSFQHHAEVCGLPENEQEQWLAAAEAGGWSRNELRRRIRMRSAEKNAIADTSYLQVEINMERKKRWQEAAESQGMSLHQWASEILDREAGKTAIVA